MLGLYGAADQGIPNDTVEKMYAALKAAGNTKSEYTLYPDTPHAFHADYRPSYRKAAGRRRVEQDAGVVQNVTNRWAESLRDRRSRPVRLRRLGAARKRRRADRSPFAASSAQLRSAASLGTRPMR